MKIQLLPLLTLISVTTMAHAEEVNLQALHACAFVENDTNRLLCYDNTMAGKSLSRKDATMVPVSASSNKPEAANAAVASSPEAKNKNFGLEHKEVAKDNDDEIKVIVKSVDEAPYGELIITLENGQQWRQIGSDNIRISSSDKVIISRGMFNSFLLKKEGQNRSIRVKRIQ
ncbi:hypothetical protein ACT3S9_00755 [Pseudoalteromonas sp. AOP31-A2-14]|uniref:hypothetical protein n=1 Tax=Pseudoalteromonas sp. AOP31-A2-14 TaxID=3457695 RepID=UPI003FB88675